MELLRGCSWRQFESVYMSLISSRSFSFYICARCLTRPAQANRLLFGINDIDD